MTDGSGVWHRRERALTLAIVLWALLVSSLATVQPDALASWLETGAPLRIAGTILLTIGVLGAVTLSALRLVAEWQSNEDALSAEEVEES